MPYETKPAAIQAPLPAARRVSRGAAGAWRHLPAIAKCIFIGAVTMALLGAEIELRLAPQIDVLLTAAGVGGILAWLKGKMPHTQ